MEGFIPVFLIAAIKPTLPITKPEPCSPQLPESHLLKLSLTHNSGRESRTQGPAMQALSAHLGAHRWGYCVTSHLGGGRRAEVELAIRREQWK